MELKNKNPESGKAGQPGEATAKAKSPAATGGSEKKNLTPASIEQLLSSGFDTPEPDYNEPVPADEGKEVQPSAKGETDEQGKKREGGKAETPAEPEWSAEQRAWFERRAEAKTPEEIEAAEAEAPEFSAEQKAFLESWQTANAAEGQGAGEGEADEALPEHLNAELKAWEAKGGTLPPSLQKLVDKRIHKIVDERDSHKQRADAAEQQVQELTAQLQSRPAAASAPNLMDEGALEKRVGTVRKFQADARAYIGDYADEAARARIEKHMAEAGLDDKGLRRQLDEINDWLSTSVPQMRQGIQAFKAEKAKVEPIVRSRFPTLSDPKTPEGKLAAEVKAFMPDLASRTPAAEFSTALYVLGMEAWNHLKAAAPDGDVIAALRETLKKGVPITANGAAKRKLFLPGKAPVKPPTSGSPVKAPNARRKDVEAEQTSASLREAPTAENATAALRNALSGL